MKEIVIIDKEKYFNEHYPFLPKPKMKSRILCIHCDQVFKVEEYRVVADKAGHEFICCPDPNCNGTLIDWIPTSRACTNRKKK